jgi:hypothetical protein
MDVVKSVIQGEFLYWNKYKNTLHCAKKLYNKHGYLAFTKGYFPAIGRAIPAAGATFVTFELTKRLLG